MTDIDKEKSIYIFVHQQKDLENTLKNLLVKNRFLNEKIIIAKSNKVGNVGEHMALLWAPNNPSNIKIQKIIKVNKIEKPEGVLGFWRGVTWDDVFEILLTKE